MAERPRGEKEEKRDEKEEKGRRPGEREGRGRGEKSWDEKWRRDPLSLILWAAVLIWAGLVLMADNLGLLGGLGPGVIVGRRELGPLGAWDLILTGAGVIVLLGVVVRLLNPSLRRPVGGSIILGVVLLAIGLGGLIGWGVIWPLVLIAIGLAILLSRIVR